MIDDELIIIFKSLSKKDQIAILSNFYESIEFEKLDHHYNHFSKAVDDAEFDILFEPYNTKLILKSDTIRSFYVILSISNKLDVVISHKKINSSSYNLIDDKKNILKLISPFFRKHRIKKIYGS